MDEKNFDYYLSEQLEIAKKEEEQRREEELKKKRISEIAEQKNNAENEYKQIMNIEMDVAVFQRFIIDFYPIIIKKIISSNIENLFHKSEDRIKKTLLTSSEYYAFDYGFFQNNSYMIDNFLRRNKIGRYVDRGKFRFEASLQELLDAYYTELQFLPEMEDNVRIIMEEYQLQSHEELEEIVKGIRKLVKQKSNDK